MGIGLQKWDGTIEHQMFLAQLVVVARLHGRSSLVEKGPIVPVGEGL